MFYPGQAHSECKACPSSTQYNMGTDPACYANLSNDTMHTHNHIHFLYLEAIPRVTSIPPKIFFREN